MKKTYVSYLFLIVISVFLISLSNTNVLANQDNVKVVKEEAKRGGYQLIDMASLHKLFLKDSTNLLLVDTRQEWEYHLGYIKGAVNFSMEPTWFSRMTKRGALENFLGDNKLQNIVFY